MDQLGSLSMIKLHNRSKVHAKVDKRVVLPTLLNSLLSLTVFFLLVGSVLAEGKTIKSHGFNFFGELNYSKDFPYLNYVNKDAPKGGEISIWSMGTFDSMNPYSRKGRAGALASAPFESLLEGTADEVGSLYGLLAETIEYPEDQTWVIFNLRDEAKFSDGTPVTAYDVKYTFELFLEQGLASYKAILGQIVQEAEVLGPKKIKYSFTPDASKRDAIPIVGGLPVMSKAWFDATGARLDESRMEIAIGSGPYVLDEFEVNKRISYKRNEDYWGNELPLMKGRSNFDTIKIEYFADTSAALEGFKSGEYTMRIENSSKNWATAYDFPALDEGNVIKKTLPDGGIASGQAFVMNLRRSKFSDPKVREAIGLLYNFEWSNESLFYGQYARINSFWENSELAAEGMPTEGELALLKPLVNDLPKGILDEEAVMASVSGLRALDRKNLRLASKLLDEAGWLVGDDGLRRNSEGEAFTLEIIERSPAFDRVVLPYVDNLRAAGIDAKYERIDSAQFTDRKRNYDFDMLTTQHPMSLEPSSGLKQYFGSESSDVSVFNSAGVSNPAIDALIEHVISAENKAELKTSVKALDRALRSLRFWVPQWFNNTYRVAYWDMYEHPDEIPPFDLGYLDFWWYNSDKAESLKSTGALR
jgi:microcin C transport system substrate-binding protein